MSRQVGRVSQQSKGETPLMSGVLQRAAVRAVADKEVEATEDVESGMLRESRFRHDFSQVGIDRGGLPPIQAKLTIGEPGDKYEQEADRVASQVVQQINAPASVQSSQGQSVQRRTEAQEEEEIQAKPENTSLQRMEAIAGGEGYRNLDTAINSARGGGQQLDAGLQRSMGQAMGADFSCVRVHTDAQSEELNQELMAKAFTTGQEVFFRQGEYNPGSRGGQELLAHELTHVVQQNGGAVQRASKSPGKATTKREITSCGIQVQRVVGNYAIGSTLATTTKAKRGLTKPQMDEVQKLHDDPSNHYTVDQAQSLAIGSNTQSNPYAWEVEGLGSYVTQNPLVQSILENFGHPITDVVKIYTDLGSRVGWEVKHGGLGALTVSDLHQHFDATMPLHVGFNSFLTDEWNGNSNGYAGKQTGIKLYDVMRSKITKDWQAEDVGNYQNLNDLLKGVSGRPPELHHLLNKSVYQANATNVMNLMIAERSASEHNDGPGQHELMHRVSSGNDQNKFKVLLNEVEEEYNNWLVKKTGNQQVRMTPG